MRSQLQCRFSSNITTLCRRLLIDVFLQRCYNVVIWWNDVATLKATTLQRRHNVVCLLGKPSLFMFNDVYYYQVDGVAVGSSFRPTLDNLFLIYYESKWLLKNHVKKFLRYINSRHYDLKFTFKEEKDNKISFLDICISRNTSALETSIFPKPTFSSVYINFNNFIPIGYKRGLMHILLYRTYIIYSSYIPIHEEMRLEYEDFNGQSIGKKMEIGLKDLH